MKSIGATFAKLPKLTPTQRILLLTHDDADGSGCAVLFRLIFPNITVQHCGNKSASRMILNSVIQEDIASNYDFIIATDISCTPADAERISHHHNRKKLMILDHHDSALDINQYPWAVISPMIPTNSYRTEYFPIEIIDKAHSSGTSLVYDYLEYCGLTDRICNLWYLKKMVHTIASYDTWDWFDLLDKDKSFSEFHKLHNLYGTKIYEDEMVKRCSNHLQIELFTETDNMLLEIENSKIHQHLTWVAPQMRTGTFQPDNSDRIYSIVTCNTPNYPQETFEYMKRNYPDTDLYIINFGTGISIRTTNPDIHVGKLLQPLGGGGHPGAGGIQHSSRNIYRLIEDTLQGNIQIHKKTSGANNRIVQ